MLSKPELLRWLNTLPDDAMVGLDEGRLTLQTQAGVDGPHLEVGGMPEEEHDSVGKTYVLTITHNHGSDTWVNQTGAGAMERAYQFVSEWWDADGPDGDKPEEHAEAVVAYFQHQIDSGGDESYSIEECEVQR